MVSITFRVDKKSKSEPGRKLKELLHAADTVIVLDTNRSLKYVQNLKIEPEFSVMSQLIDEIVTNFTEIITKPSTINIDYSDMDVILEHASVATIIVKEWKNKYKNTDAICATLNYPSIDIDYRNATGCIISITVGPDMCLYETRNIAESFTYDLSPSTNVIWGVNTRNDHEGKINFMAIMVGLQKPTFLE